MSKSLSVRSRSSRRRSAPRALPRPNGVIEARVQTVGPERFGIVAVDCAKRSSKWRLYDFYGKELTPVATVEHTAPAFRQAIDALRAAVAKHRLAQVLIAVERTSNYHLFAQRAFRDAGYETRIVHPFASKQFRQIEDPDQKTDEKDLGGIQRATVVGFGLLELPLDETYATLRALVRHRRDLVRKTSVVLNQIREHLQGTLPGFADLFEGSRFWNSPVTMPLARRFASPEAVRQLGADGIAKLLNEEGVRFQQRTIDKIVGWSHQATTPYADAVVRQRILADLDDDRIAKKTVISRLELEIAAHLVRTPYLLLMAIPGINVVSAAEFAGEAGPITDYANPNRLTGRAGLFPTRYQSDEVDRTGHLVRSANRRLRSALLFVADNLLTSNNFFRAQGAVWKVQKIPAGIQRVRVAKRFTRLAYLMVAARKIVPHPCCRDPHYILEKLLDFHLMRGAAPDQLRAALARAAEQIPGEMRAREADALRSSARKFEKARTSQAQTLGSILKEVLADRLSLTVQSPAEV